MNFPQSHLTVCKIKVLHADNIHNRIKESILIRQNREATLFEICDDSPFFSQVSPG